MCIPLRGRVARLYSTNGFLRFLGFVAGALACAALGSRRVASVQSLRVGVAVSECVSIVVEESCFGALSCTRLCVRFMGGRCVCLDDRSVQAARLRIAYESACAFDPGLRYLTSH
jgi:hypothetical protein